MTCARDEPLFRTADALARQTSTTVLSSVYVSNGWTLIKIKAPPCVWAGHEEMKWIGPRLDKSGFAKDVSYILCVWQEELCFCLEYRRLVSAISILWGCIVPKTAKKKKQKKSWSIRSVREGSLAKFSVSLFKDGGESCCHAVGGNPRYAAEKPQLQRPWGLAPCHVHMHTPPQTSVGYTF